MRNAVSDAMHSAVDALRSEVVQHDHRRAVLGEIVLEREDLPPIAQGALRKQTNLRQTVNNDALRANMLQGASWNLVGHELLIIAGWLVVCFTLALRLFRWK